MDPIHTTFVLTNQHLANVFDVTLHFSMSAFFRVPNLG